MSTDRKYVDFVVDQMKGAGCISFKQMFGEYAIYCNDKMIGVICENKLFIKPTAGGKSFIGEVTETSPFCNSELYFLLEDEIYDPGWLSDLVDITSKEVDITQPPAI